MCSGGGGGGGGGMGVGMATNIIGSEMERWAAILAADAMNKQFSQQMKTQNMFRGQGGALFGQYVPKLSSEQAGKDMATGAANREVNYNDIQARSLAPSDKSDAATNAQLALQGQQRARLGSYGDWQTQQSSQASDFQSGINRIANRAAGSAQVFPYQMSRAQHSMDWLNMLGEMIKGVGGGSANFGMLTQQPPTEQQSSAMSAGYGPVSAQYANQLRQQYYQQSGMPNINQQFYNMQSPSSQYAMSLYGY